MVERFETEVTGKEKRQLGASLVEFTLLVALVAVVTITSVRRLGFTIQNRLTFAASKIDGAGGLQCDHLHPNYPDC